MSSTLKKYDGNRKDFKKIPTTNTTLEIKKEIEDINTSYNSQYLQRFQYIVKEYFVKSGQRGILINHEVGSGKTITAISIAEEYRKIDTKRKIIILTTKSLQDNFKSNIRKYIRSCDHLPNSKIHDIVDDRYNFVSLNAGNMYENMVKKFGGSLEEFINIIENQHIILKSKDNIKSNKKHNTISSTKFDSISDSISDDDKYGGSNRFLENSLIIIDEVHNFCNSIINGSKNGVKLYDILMHTNNIKIVFLTGTPIIDSPFILVPLFNMLKGYIYMYNTKHTLFPENKDEFDNLFVGRDGTIKNKHIFQNRIIGLISYYGNYYFINKNKEGFPTEKALIIERVPMSGQQLIRYQEMRSMEDKEKPRYNKSISSTFNVKESTSSTYSYKIRSRQAANFSIPSYAIHQIVDRTSDNSSTGIKIEKDIYNIKKDDLQNLERYSPKFEKILSNLRKYDNQLSVVYSEFVNGEGIILFSRVLEAVEGYVYWHENYASNIDYFESSYENNADNKEEEFEREEFDNEIFDNDGSENETSGKGDKSKNYTKKEEIKEYKEWKKRRNGGYKYNKEDIYYSDNSYSNTINKYTKNHNDITGSSAAYNSCDNWIYNDNCYDIFNSSEENIYGGVKNKSNSTKKNNNAESKLNNKEKNSNKKTYALIHGGVPQTERTRIIKAFNSNANSHGQIISVLLISKSGAEGLSLRNVRSIHIMEPFWNYARIEQVIARGVRFNSHITLEPEERNIQPYLYISILGDDTKKLSTDEELLNVSLLNKKIRDNYSVAMIESSIDCSINVENDPILKDNIKCNICSPNNKRLYSVNIYDDININNCTHVGQIEISVKKVKIPGDDTTYYYKRDNTKIIVYEYNEKIGKYVEMQKNNPLYSHISLYIINETSKTSQ